MTAPCIRVIDFETTGMERPPAEVVEAGWCDLTQMPDGSWDVGEAESELFAVDAIPPEVRAVHHITMDDVVGCRTFDPLALLLDAVNAGAVVLAAHNMEFEHRFFGTPSVPLLCTYKAALRVWPDAPSHSNGALRYWLEDQGLLSLEHAKAMPPHRAGPDAYVTAHVLKALLTKATAKQMVAWTREPRLLPTCPIGKFRGKPWADVEAGFLNWMLRQPDMEADLKWNAERELERRRVAA